MIHFDLFGQKHEDDMTYVEPEEEEVEVLPLHDIPVGMEDAPVHDGINPCGDPYCYCATYGYGVPSLS